MKIHTSELDLSSKGNGDVIDITGRVIIEIEKVGIKNGLVTVFVPGATAGVTTIEFEEGLVRDLKAAWDELVPRDRTYAHNLRWGDGNGHSHVRATMLGPSLSVPIASGQLILGTWQQIILVDFDNRPRNRRFICQIMGE
jgi:secondary thiamine-phosphate synthase enzyme